MNNEASRRSRNRPSSGTPEGARDVIRAFVRTLEKLDDRTAKDSAP